nr:LacI family DNA-binding transcriptional regulator [Bacilli bacterium]
MITIADVARKAHVSAMTVSRVINNTATVSEATRQRVLDAMESLSYVPNSVARSLIIGKTHTIGLVLADLTNPFFTTIARGAEDTAHDHRYRLILCDHDDNPSKEKQYIDALISARVDGMVIVPANDSSKSTLSKLDCHKIPFVLLDRLVDNIEADTIIGNNREAAFRLTQHLIDQGHRKIAIIIGPQDIYTARERFNGYLEALGSNYLPILPQLITQTSFEPYHKKKDDQPHLFATIATWMSSADRPTAIIAANNMVAIAVLQQLKALHLRCEEDVALVCFEEIDPHGILEPSLTCAAQPAYQLGKLAVSTLFDRLMHPESPIRTITLPIELHYRSSSSLPKQRESVKSTSEMGA